MAAPTSCLLRRGALRRCAVCGGGGLFRRWVQMVPECPRCGLRFNRVEGHWLGSWFLNVCLVQTVVVLILVLGVGFTYPDPPMLAISIGAGVAAVVVPLLFFPWSRTLWVAIDVAMRPLEFDDGVAPGFELEDDIEQVRREPPPGRAA